MGLSAEEKDALRKQEEEKLREAREKEEIRRKKEKADADAAKRQAAEPLLMMGYPLARALRALEARAGAQAGLAGGRDRASWSLSFVSFNLSSRVWNCSSFHSDNFSRIFFLWGHALRGGTKDHAEEGQELADTKPPLVSSCGSG